MKMLRKSLQIFKSMSYFSEIPANKTSIIRPGTVAHTCNPSYVGGIDREDPGSGVCMKSL
jgi:hypothetical protein